MRTFTVLPEEVWLHRYPTHGAALEWLSDAHWCSLTTSDHNLSVACDREDAPGAESTTGPYRVLRIRDLNDHGALGIVASVAKPLAEAGISIFTVSSWDTCDTLVPAHRLAEAVDALMVAGYPVDEA